MAMEPKFAKEEDCNLEGEPSDTDQPDNTDSSSQASSWTRGGPQSDGNGQETRSLRQCGHCKEYKYTVKYVTCQTSRSNGTCHKFCCDCLERSKPKCPQHTRSYIVD